ncbi:hypothetical protein [Halolamina salina]|uniref:Uncharacterized protein n=1 Tax=Halolamina salina TaxID=1220023 RepID=A0ABD6BAU6_9EURY
MLDSVQIPNRSSDAAVWVAVSLAFAAALYLFPPERVGLFLDLCGALVLLAPYLRAIESPLLAIPSEPFRSLAAVERLKTDIPNNPTLNSEDDAFSRVAAQIAENYGVEATSVEFSHQSRPWTVNTIDIGSEETASVVRIKGTRPQIQDFLDKIIERTFLRVGAVLLVLGFGLQLLAGALL